MQLLAFRRFQSGIGDAEKRAPDVTAARGSLAPQRGQGWVGGRALCADAPVGPGDRQRRIIVILISRQAIGANRPWAVL